jgi:hypothetical protein
MPDRKDVNRLFAKLYAYLAADLGKYAADGDQEKSQLYQLHLNQINAYYEAVHSGKATQEQRETLANAVLDAFVQVLDPAEGQRLKEWFETTTTGETAITFAEGMASVFRLRVHRALRPYDPGSEDQNGILDPRGW